MRLRSGGTFGAPGSQSHTRFLLETAQVEEATTSGFPLAHRNPARFNLTVPLELPNLFVTESRDIATRLYAVAIPRLLWRGRPAEALEMIRRVRAFGTTSRVAARWTMWTYSFEFEALVALGEFESAWRLMRKHLRLRYPLLANQPVEQRVRWMPDFVAHTEMSAAFFSGRVEYAARAMEAFLAWSVPRAEAYEVRYGLYNGDPAPTLFRVTLFHIYARLGRKLSSWPLWSAWVSRLDAELLRITGISREDLRVDSDKLVEFEKNLRAAEEGRRPAGVTFGQRDVLEPKKKVLARQRRIIDHKPSPKQAAFSKMLQTKRAHYFPWLATL